MSLAYQQVVNELHHQARRKFLRRRVIVKGLQDLYQADLIEMIPYAHLNKGNKYILVLIDVFSKYVWALPLKTKAGGEVTSVMKKLIEKQPPSNLQTDQGKEFYNQNFAALMKLYKINHYSTFSSIKASVVERVIRTLKSWMWKKFTLQGNKKWLDLLPQIVEKYNNSIHRTIKMKPKIAIKKSNEKKLLTNVYNHIKMVNPQQKFNVGDHVRISKYRTIFDKGYLENWTNEIFKIARIQITFPTTYILQDAKNETLRGAFYEHELQKVKYPEIYLIEKIIRKKGNKILVKWRGINESTWINKSDIK
jgi:hypothetical protein